MTTNNPNTTQLNRNDTEVFKSPDLTVAPMETKEVQERLESLNKIDKVCNVQLIIKF